MGAREYEKITEKNTKMVIIGPFSVNFFGFSGSNPGRGMGILYFFVLSRIFGTRGFL